MVQYGLFLFSAIIDAKHLYTVVAILGPIAPISYVVMGSAVIGNHWAVELVQ